MNKLLVGGIFCDLEKAFDCIDHGILLSELNFYGISGKDPALFQSYMDNGYFRTAIHNDRGNSNKVPGWANFRHAVPQGSVLEPLLFLLYINDLSKIINKTSATTIFAVDTCILFAHSNLTDFNNNFNLLKPTGHVTHQQFNIQKLYALPTLYLCVLYLSDNKQRLVPLTA